MMIGDHDHRRHLTAAGYSPWLAVALGLLCACVVAILSYLVAVKPILAFDRFSFGWLVSTLGFAVVVENAAAYIWGPTSRAFPPILNGSSVHIGDAVLTEQQLLAIARRGRLHGRLRARAQAHAVRQARHGDRRGSRDGLGDRREHDGGRDRGLRDLRPLRGGRRRADRAQHLRQSLSRRHLRHLRLHRHDDRRRHREARGRDVRRPAARRAVRRRQCPDQLPGVGLVSVPRAGRHPDRDPAGLFSSGSCCTASGRRRLARR